MPGAVTGAEVLLEGRGVPRDCAGVAREMVEGARVPWIERAGVGAVVVCRD